MPTLPSATSVVDFLKGKGFKPQAGERLPLFEQRRQIYNTLGLDKQLGEFRGTAVQNPALIQALSRAERSAGVSLNPQNLQSVLTIARGGGQPTPQARPQIGQAPTAFPARPADIAPQQTQPIQAPQPIAQAQPEVSPTAQPPSLPSQQQEPQPLTAPEIQQRALDIFKQPSEQDVAQKALAQVTGSATFPFEQERVQAEKEKVQLQAKQQTENLISQMASRGFSLLGKTQKGVSAIETDKLAKLLDVDRGFAYLLARGLDTAAQQAVKEAQQGSREAQEALNKLGYGFNPLTGEIGPTLEAQRIGAQERQQQLQAQQFQQQEARREEGQTQQAQQFQQSQERLERQSVAQQQRFESQQTLAEARLAVSTAQNQAQLKLAEKRLDLAEKKAAKTNQQLMTGLLTNQQFQRVNALADNARQDQNIKTFDSVRDSFQRIATAAQSKDHGVGDLTLLRSFAKLTDPTTGVREEEYRTMQQALGSLQRLGVNITTGMVSGAQLTPAGRKAFLNMSNDLYNAHKTNYDQAVTFYKDQAINSGVDPKLVLPRIVSNVTPSTGKATGAQFKAPSGKTYKLPY